MPAGAVPRKGIARRHRIVTGAPPRVRGRVRRLRSLHQQGEIAHRAAPIWPKGKRTAGIARDVIAQHHRGPLRAADEPKDLRRLRVEALAEDNALGNGFVIPVVFDAAIFEDIGHGEPWSTKPDERTRKTGVSPGCFSGVHAGAGPPEGDDRDAPIAPDRLKAELRTRRPIHLLTHSEDDSQLSDSPTLPLYQQREGRDFAP